MLQRQQASAVIAARQKIVEGAVGMVEHALEMLNEKKVVALDDERRAQMVQNLLVLCFANTLFEPLWNMVSIDYVQISVAETVGVESRGVYYDEYGALRDMVQSYLF